MSNLRFIGDEIVVNTSTANDQYQPTIAALPDGRFVVTWYSLDQQGSDTSSSGIRGRIFNADGTPAANDFVVNSTTVNDQSQPTVAALPDGRFVVTWQSNDQQGSDASGAGIRGRIFNADGTPTANDFVVNTTTDSNQILPTIAALPDGRFVVTWWSYDQQGTDTSGYGIRGRIFNADGTPAADDFVVNTSTANDQCAPTIAALPDGRFVVTWYSYDQQGSDTSSAGIRGRLFNADGTPAADDFVVNTATANYQSQPTIAALPNGRFVVTWFSYDQQGTDTSSYGIRGRIFNADGTPAADDFVVNTTTANEQIAPTIAALPNGRFVVTWYSFDQQGSDTSLCIRGRIFNADGMPAANDFVVNTSTVSYQFAPTIAALPDGRFVVTWYSNDQQGSDTSGYGIRMQVFDLNGDPVNTAPTDITLSANSIVEFPGSGTVVGTLAVSDPGDVVQLVLLDNAAGRFALDGNHLIVRDGVGLQYEQSATQQVTVRARDSAGNTFDKSFTIVVLDDDTRPIPGTNVLRPDADVQVNTTTANNQYEPTIAALSDGRFVVTWYSYDQQGSDTSSSGIRGRIFNADGTSAANDFVVNTTTVNGQYEPTIAALPDGRFVVTWYSDDNQGSDTSSSGIRGRIFNADGTPAANDFIVNTSTANNQVQPTIAALPDGRFVVTWWSYDQQGTDTSGAGIRGRIFNADGTPAADDFVVNTTTYSDQIQPTIAALSDGRFVATWYSLDQEGSDTSGYGIRGRIFNADGTPVASDFVVNSTTVSYQYEPTIAALPGGRFVVTWYSYDQQGSDTSGSGIRGRIFNADGTPAANDFVVNSTTVNDQYQPTVAALPDGRFVVTWYSYDQQGSDTSGYGIRGRVFNADGTPAANDFVVNTATANDQSQPTIAALPDGRLVVTWYSNDQQGSDTSGLGIRMQILSLQQTNVAPTAPATAAVTTDEDTTSAATAIGAADANGDTLTYTVKAGFEPAKGSVSFANGNFVYSPALNANGTDSFTIVVSDGHGGATEQIVSVTINPINDAPTAPATTDVTTKVDTATAAIGVGAADIDGDSLTYTVKPGFESAKGSVSFANGAFVYQPGVGATGLDSFTILVADGHGGTTEQVVSVTITNDPIIGTESPEVIVGNSAANTMFGLGGNDTLNGGLGADTMTGGDGSDTYYVDNAGDVVIETNADLATGGTDRVYSSVSFTLGANVDYLYLTGTAAIDGTGNEGANYFLGNAAANTIYGLGGNDNINGGLGADSMFGGDGNDIYIVDNTGDVVTETNSNMATGGIDTVYSSVTFTLGANVENLYLNGTAAIDATGNDGANYLLGNAAANMLSGLGGNDSLNGGLGADVMAGGDGNDTYYVDNTGDVVTETNANIAIGGTDRVYSSVSFTLGTNVETLYLTGTAAIDGTGNDGANYLLGNAAGNFLYGLGGNDTLDGGLGPDVMIGGNGNDSYYVDNASDVVTETNADAVTGGIDTVYSSVTFGLGDNVETLYLTGTAAIDGAGNNGANYLFGNAAANVLDGFGGNDTLNGGLGADAMSGGDGNDIYYVDNAGDVVTETNADTATGGIDTIYSSVTSALGANVESLYLTGTAAIDGAGNDLANAILGNSAGNILSGLGGNDTLNGGLGADAMSGGDGSDTYFVDNTGDVVTETNADTATGGIDRVYSSVSFTLGANVDYLYLTGTAAIDGTGNEGANYFLGNAAANTLFGFGGNDNINGGLGADSMFGGDGNDIYIVDNAGDVVTETNDNAATGGIDTIYSSVTYALGANIENLYLNGTAAIDATGNSLANYLLGNAAANTLSGGEGADTMSGGAGNDTYVVDNSGDRVIEGAGNGTDLVLSSVSYTLAANVENLTLVGTAALNATGNALGNLITGNDGTNVINGGLGSDILFGGAAADAFVFNTALGSTNVDSLADFAVLEDTIQLENAVMSGLGTATGALAANMFVIGDQATTTAEHILYNSLSGDLFYDADGSGALDKVQIAHLEAGLTLTNTNFWVI